MSAIDISKIKPGDTVTAEHTVAEVVAGRVYAKASLSFCGSTISNSSSVWIEKPVSHTPARREIRVGDKMKGVDGDHESYEVIGVDGDSIWLKNSRGYRFDVQTSRIRHAEPAP